MRAPCVILCLIGVYLSVLLLQMQTESPGVPGFVKSICERVEGCHQVLQSKWAFVPPAEKTVGTEPDSVLEEFAFPVSVFGLGYFSGLLIWLLFIGRATTAANTVVLIIGLVSCLVSVWYLYLIHRVVGAACPFCLIAHAVNFLLFGATLVYFFREEGDAYQPGALYGATGVAILTLWAAIGFGWRAASLSSDSEALTRKLDSMRSDIDTIEMVWRAGNPVEIAIREKVELDPTLHALPGFRNTVVIFGDPADPVCRRTSEYLLDQIRPYYAGHLRVVWKHHPTGDERSVSWKTARSLEAARMQGKFWTYLRLIFENQSHLDRVDFVQLAVDAGMNPNEFSHDWRSADALERIRTDVATAHSAGVTEMPAVFLNSRRVDSSIRGLTGFWKFQAAKLKTLRLQKGQGWGTSGSGLASGSVGNSSAD